MTDKEYLAEDEEGERLIKVVEYLEPTMDKELLSKFPDNSAFDFDYTQSSIWSPLAPRAFKSFPRLEMERLLDFSSSKEEKKKDKDDDGMTVRTKQRKQCLCMGLVNKSKVSTSKIEKKTSKYKQRATTLKSSKAWDGVLKAASKHFKKTKKKDQIVHMKFSQHNIKNVILSSDLGSPHSLYSTHNVI